MVVTSPLLQAVLDAMGTLVFAVSGGIVGVRKGLDVFSVLVLAAATGLGGGFVRDLAIGAIPPAALDSLLLLGAAVTGGLLAFLRYVPIGRVERWVGMLDALGLGPFAVVGEAGTYGTATALAAVAAAATLRIVAMLRGWNAWRAPGTGRT